MYSMYLSQRHTPNVRNKANLAGRPVSRRVLRAKQTQFGPVASSNRVQLRQTNPIRRRPAMPGAVCAKQSQFPGSTGSDKVRGARDAGQTCKTKPISVRQAGTRRPPTHRQAPRRVPNRDASRLGPRLRLPCHAVIRRQEALESPLHWIRGVAQKSPGVSSRIGA